MATVFIHGMDSSSRGLKARWFKEHFPEVLVPDFSGALDVRMKELNTILAGSEELVLTGTSFGGLMAVIYAMENQDRVRKVILLAPALNFPDAAAFTARKTAVPGHLYIGRQDTVCPPDVVIPAAQNIFTDLAVHVSDDDHLLRKTFTAIDWAGLLRD